MSERTERTAADEAYARQRELQQQRQRWQEQRRQQKQQQERDEKRSRLEEYLRRRTEAWTDTSGTPPPSAVLVEWQRQYLDEQELVRQSEREARLAEAENQPHYHPHV